MALSGGRDECHPSRHRSALFSVGWLLCWFLYKIQAGVYAGTYMTYRPRLHGQPEPVPDAAAGSGGA
eukprot:2019334-Rhodomonas_salina.1